MIKNKDLRKKVVKNKNTIVKVKRGKSIREWKIFEKKNEEKYKWG